jgi:hypothetical protein
MTISILLWVATMPDACPSFIYMYSIQDSMMIGVVLGCFNRFASSIAGRPSSIDHVPC